MTFNINNYGKHMLDIIMKTLKPKIESKQDKVAGKGLSTNDLTNDLLALLTLKKVKDVTGDAANNKLIITYTDDSTAEVAMDALVTDIHVKGATLDATSNVLTLTAENGPDITVDLSDFVNSSELAAAMDTKVDKVAGKGLSTNDFTNELKSAVELKKVKELTKNIDKLHVDYTDGTAKDIDLLILEGSEPTQADSDAAYNNA